MTTETKAIEIKTIKSKITLMQKAVDDVDIKDMAAVHTMTSKIKIMLDYVEQEKEKYVGPAKLIIEEAKMQYDPYIKICKDAKDSLKSKAVAHLMEVKRLEEVERAKIAAKEAADRKKIEDDLAAGKITVEKAEAKLEKQQEKAVEKMSKVEEAGNSHGGITVRMVSKMEIVDRNLVPDEYWVIDEVKLRKDVLGGKEVAGTKIIKVANGSM